MKFIIMSLLQYSNDVITLDTLFELLKASAFAGASIFIAWVLTLAMKRNKMKTNMTADILICGISAVIMYLDYSFSITALKGMLLLFILLYASWSDITFREVGDYVWIMIFILAFIDYEKVGIISMLIGAVAVFVPQFILAVLFPIKSFGGADIKISTALASLLGAQKGIAAYLIGLILSVVFMIVYRKIKHTDRKEAFPLVPFLSVGAMLLFLLP